MLASICHTHYFAFVHVKLNNTILWFMTPNCLDPAVVKFHHNLSYLLVHLGIISEKQKHTALNPLWQVIYEY